MSSSMKNALGILFGVEGGGSISGASGKRIKKELDDIVAALNKGGGMKVELGVSSKEAKQATKDQTAELIKQKSALKDAERAYIALHRAQKAGLQSGGDKAVAHFKALERSLDEAKKAAIETGEALDAGTAKMEAATTKNTLSAQRQWDKYASNVRATVLRMYDTISKDDASKKMADNLLDLTKSADPSNIEKLKQKFGEFNAQVRQSGADVETWGQKFKKTFSGHIKTALAGLITGTISKAVHDVYQNVVDLDSAMVDLQIASGKSRADAKELIKEYSKLGQTLGATTSEVAASANTWLRQGYNTADAQIMIQNSMMLSKLGQMESEEASRALTSAMKGYNVTVQDSISIVDKLTAVDMQAATSAGDIATAMAETAAGARVAGVSMDELIGYISIVSEVTQDGAESVGTFYKTLFARMGNISAGNYVDSETGESLNNVEAVINSVGISLRQQDGTFREFSKVLNDVAAGWSTYNNVTQHALATAFAGTRQQEKFIVLMENYGKATEYTTTALESAGVASEKFNDYTQGLNGKLNALQTAFEKFSTTLLDSDSIIQLVEIGIQLVNVLDKVAAFIDKIGGLNTVIITTISLLAVINLHKITGFVTTLISNVQLFSTTLRAAYGHGLTFGHSVSAAFNSVGISISAAQMVLTGFVTLLTSAIAIFSWVSQSQQETIRNYLTSSDAARSEAEQNLKNIKNVRALAEEYRKLAENSDGVYDTQTIVEIKSIQSQITDLVGDQAKNIDLVNGKYEDQLGLLKDITKQELLTEQAKAKVSVEDATNAYIEQRDSWDDAFFGNYTVDKNAKSRQEGIDVLSNTDIAWHKQGAGSGAYYTEYAVIQDDFDNIKDFIAQYDKLTALQQQLAVDGKGQTAIYQTVTKFLEDYSDIYTTYTKAKSTYDAITDALNNTSVEGDNNTGGGNNPTTPVTQTKEELEEILNKYEELVKLRKELLETYKKELEYERELAKKQKNVTNISSQLALAQLDNSAAGQARARELQAELDDAQAELDDFTLEHAIDVISSDLDTQADEFKSFIEQQINKLTAAINGGKETTPETVVPTSSTNTAGASRVTKVPGGGRYVAQAIYHSGGFVGELESNEEFAKLLKGEFVSTPAMMKNFVENTLPAVASYGGTEINSPLVTIQCGGITEDTLPEFERAVSRAVNEIKRELNSGMSRTGYKQRIKALN